MSGVRVLVSMTVSPEDEARRPLAGRLAQYESTAKEDGCVQYELFRSVSDPTRMMLVENWSSQKLYDLHWRNQLERQKNSTGQRSGSSSVEFYRHQVYKQVDGCWVPSDPAESSEIIRWA